MAFHGKEDKLASVTIKENRTGQTEEIQPAGVFAFIGQDPNSDFLAGSDVRLDPWGTS